MKKHVQNIIWKLRAADRTQAAIIAFRMGLLEIDKGPAGRSAETDRGTGGGRY